MRFADLFKPTEQGRVTADDADNPTLTLFNAHKTTIGEKVNTGIGKGSGLARSALSAPLIPLDSPFIEGERYRLAHATEWPSRLDLYLADRKGPWRRLYGVLMPA